MPPPVTGDTMPAASPTSITRREPSRDSVAARRDQPAAPFLRLDLAQVAEGFEAVQEPAEVGLGGPGRGDADLRRADAGHDPGDVARRDLAVGKAMQEARVEAFQLRALDLHAGEEMPVAAEAETFRDARARTIGADQEARMQVERGQRHAALMLQGVLEFRAVHQLRAGALASAAIQRSTPAVSVAWKK